MVQGKQMMENKSYAVVVVGSGPAGLCAAVACARMGTPVALVERAGVVGGNLTIGHVGPVMGTVAPGTLQQEVIDLLGTQGKCVQHDVEQAKVSLTRWVAKERIDLYLQAQVIETICEDGRITGVRCAEPGGVRTVSGRVLIDATGDGSVAAMAGAPFEMGREDGLTQPATVMFTLAGIHPETKIICTHEEDDTLIEGKSYLQMCRDGARNGDLPENVTIVRLYPTVRAGERMVNASQANRVDGLDARDIGRIQRELREQLPKIHGFLKENVPGFQDSYIRDSSDSVGFRETRRIMGEYVLTGEDIVNGRKFQDVVVHNANFCIDIHNPDGGGQAESEGCPQGAQDYDIPYRSLLPLGVGHLLLAGRCISGTHRAHASYRVMNICMACGHAAGVAAALSAQGGIAPREMNVGRLQKELTRQGVRLFDH